MVEPPITYLAFPLPTFLISTISFSIMVNLSCSFLIPEYHGQPANTLANDFWTLNIIYARPNDIADRFLNITFTATGEIDFNRTRREDFDNRQFASRSEFCCNSRKSWDPTWTSES